jgi:transcriptional regulator with XRE-family HTH domain
VKPEERDAQELVNLDRGSILEEAIGRQLRKLRLDRDLTVVELSKSASVSIAMISKIENGQTSPSLSTLHRLAEGLRIPLTTLFQQYEESRDASYVAAGQGLEIERRGTRAGHQYHLLGHGVRSEVDVEPYLITLNEKSDIFPMFQHRGVEFIHMLEGEMEYRHNDRVYTLRPGDSLLFDPQAAHGPEKFLKFPIQFLAVLSYAQIP